MSHKEKVFMYVLGSLPFVMVVGNSMFLPILPSLEEALSISSSEAGFILTAFSIPAALIIPFVGYLADRFGKKNIILLSLLLVMIGSIISSIAPIINATTISYYLLLIGRLIQGFGAGGTTPLAMSIISDYFQGEKRSTALGTVEVFNGIGKMVSPFLGIAALAIVWHSTFWFYFLFSCITFVCIFYIVKEDTGNRNIKLAKYGKGVYKLVKKEYKWLMPIYFSGSTVLFILFGLLVYLAYEAEIVYQVTGVYKGILFLVPLGTLTGASYSSSRFIAGQKRNAYVMIVAAFFIMFVGIIIGILSHSFTILVLTLMFVSIGTGLLLPCCNFFVTSSVFNHERGTALSLYGMVRFLGVALGPYFYSMWMYDEREMFIYTFIILLFGVVWLYVGWITINKK
ncbi:MFS transporter [Evansella cellulosilytica]|uniref:Major facilitator superfamily MFS_1 n=1 Tax=Evansella cellulosilytica (strain ATCC 21833 / DSM 2522 / FERM P-1141 / JCM 9156 / N-4) TaxID=649639 RepID=E6TWV3_EVAC2|nr:MFS transporter [Evansella cellulosilytica]ADU29903.1 major facilitator superfamily MFS_1 [Evansella cellulosilytica DSM 2522]